VSSRPLDLVSFPYLSLRVQADIIGVMVLPRSPIPNHLEEEEIAERTEVDVSLLPPG
jgi:hypothetical protein